MSNNSGINIIETDKTGICFIGDIHGEFKSLKGLMKHTGFTDTLYIICGDCGFGFEKDQYYSDIFNRISKTAASYNCEFLMLHGNHDDKSYFDGKRINRKYFKAIPDYTVIKTPIYNVLCVGGATSIDRTYRIETMNKMAFKYARYHNCSIEEAKKYSPRCYWDDEAPIYDENVLNELKEQGIKIDIVATHTCPSFCKPLTKDGIQYWLNYDPTLEETINEERAVMDKIYAKLIADGHPLQKWFYGHYHFHNQEYINGVQFVTLDMYRNGNFDIYDFNTR